ncbi:hypothetical protein [Streptomyces sp. NPDC048551]|uniref:hypothetical protein n=1 Tax=Streptomyces sp. NPDC048551 TaxID=3155758 RepID=UPI003419642F
MTDPAATPRPPCIDGDHCGELLCQPPAQRRRLSELEHDAAWHAIEGAAGEDDADPGTVLAAVLRALDIDPPGTGEQPEPRRPFDPAEGLRRIAAEDDAALARLRQLAKE